MSMTKRYIESLSAAEQNEILGGYYAEWTDSAENEPTDEELAEWAQALAEEDDEPDEWDDSAPDDDIYRGEGDIECSMI